MDKFCKQETMVILAGLFVVCSTDFFLLRKNSFDNLTFEPYSVGAVAIVPTLISCAYRCILNKACVSLLYNKQSKLCLFKSVVFVSPSDGSNDYGTKYYIVNEEGCPSDFIRNRQHDLCYKPYINTVDYLSDAKNNCMLDSNILLRATTVAAYNHVSDQLMVTPEGDGYGYYVDGSDDQKEGHWIFENGEDMTAFIWGNDEPDNYTDSDFIYIKYSNGRYVMSDTNSELYGGYICQRMMTASMTIMNTK